MPPRYLDCDFEVQGLTPTAQAAMLMQRYLHEYDVPADGLAGFALNAHANGAGNPNAMFRQAIKPETYSRAPLVNAPLRQFDVAPNADGAAAVVLTRAERLPGSALWPRVRIAGSASVTDTLSLHDRAEPLLFECCRPSAEKAMKQAGSSSRISTSLNTMMRTASTLSGA
jgi:acetyl-CoA C-acetyltransferase